MRRNFEINPSYITLREELLKIPEIFSQEGEIIVNVRNTIKKIRIGGKCLNVKSFKIPHAINRFAYRWFRKSKAQRSYEYANLLLSRGVGTPSPLAYIVFEGCCGIKESFYISEQLENVTTFRELVKEDKADLENLLREFTRFTYKLHQSGIWFMDHSPGNTLIREMEKGYEFYLVDLNRLKFKKIPPFTGLKNFYRLNMTDPMIDIVAGEYAVLTNSNPEEMKRLLKEWTHTHNEKVTKRRALKASKNH